MKYTIIVIWFQNHHTTYSNITTEQELVEKLETVRDNSHGTLQTVYIVESHVDPKADFSVRYPADILDIAINYHKAKQAFPA
jgi:hypothetical protein